MKPSYNGCHCDPSKGVAGRESLTRRREREEGPFGGRDLEISLTNSAAYRYETAQKTCTSDKNIP